MATHLRHSLDDRIADGSITGLSFSQATQSNAVFAVLPPGVADRLRKAFRFYDWNPATGEVRWMCSFDTTEGDVDAFVSAIAKELAA
jgi:threonine aldolase